MHETLPGLFCFVFFAEAKASFIISSVDKGAFCANADVIEISKNPGNKRMLFMVRFI